MSEQQSFSDSDSTNQRSGSPDAMMKEVNAEYEKVLSKISKLGTDISNLVSKQEEDFLDAYKSHMERVRDEFQGIRAEVDEKERQLIENEEVVKLTKERNWYQSQALQLDELLGVAKKNEKQLSKKVGRLQEENDWYSTQLKEKMKEKLIKEGQY